jgi:hypothetical protein
MKKAIWFIIYFLLPVPLVSGCGIFNSQGGMYRDQIA